MRPWFTIEDYPKVILDLNVAWNQLWWSPTTSATLLIADRVLIKWAERAYALHHARTQTLRFLDVCERSQCLQKQMTTAYYKTMGAFSLILVAIYICTTITQNAASWHCSLTECKSLTAISNGYENLVSQFLFTRVVTELEHVEACRCLGDLFMKITIIKIPRRL